MQAYNAGKEGYDVDIEILCEEAESYGYDRYRGDNPCPMGY